MRTIHIKRAHNGRHPAIKAALLIAGLLIASVAWAALPPPTPAQQQAAAAKKAAADAQAAKDKESLSASMDAVSTRWRARAAQQGWKTHAPVAIASAAPAPAAGAGGIVTAAGTAAQSAGQGEGRRELPPGLAAANPIVKSEKLGTAPPSEDHKAGPTRSVPRGTAPTVQKGSPEGVSKK